MNTINARIRILRKSLRLSQSEFGSKIGLQPSSLSDIENEKCDVTKRNIINICSQFNVSEEWLVTENGNMFIEENKKFDEFFEIYKDLSPILQEFLNKVAKDLLETQEKL